MMIDDDTLSGDTQEFGTGTLDTTQVTDTRQSIRKEIRALLEVIEGPSKGMTLAFDDRILVGRQNDCDLVIEDKRVSRQHLRIERTGKKLVATALNKNNPVLLGPKAISSAPLKDGDILRIGESVLRVSMGAAPDKGAARGSGKSNKMRMVIYVLIIVFALGILIVAVLPSKKESPSRSLVEQERGKLVRIQDAALKREISIHLTNGKQFLESRDYVRARSRFKRVLELAPDNAEAQSLLAEVESHIKNDEEQILQAEQRAREIREKLSLLFTEANVLFATKDYAKARETLLQAQELAPGNPDVNKLLSEVEQALEEQRAQQEELAAQQEKALIKVKHSHAKAMHYRDEKQHYHALREFLYLLSLDVESAETDTARRLVPELEQQLLEMTRKDFIRGEELLAKDNPTEALQAWRAVLDVYPDHKDAKARIERLMPAIAQKGKELYQEGQVYEDLGQAQMAVKKWLEAVETLAIVPDDEYLAKAKQKLESYPSLASSPRD